MVLSHGNFIAASLMVTMDQEVSGEKQNVFLCVLPMFHVFGLAVILYSQLQIGNAVVSMTRFELEDPTDEVTRLQIGVTEEVARGRELGSEQIGADRLGSEQLGEDGGGASLDRSRSRQSPAE